MKKTKLISVALIILIILSVSVSGCYKSWKGKRPCDQPNTQWASDKYGISFRIDENGPGFGQFVFEGEVVEILVAIGPSTEIDIYPLSSLVGNYVDSLPIEQWTGDFKKANVFTAVVEKSTYFEVGEKITFYRVDDNTTSDPANQLARENNQRQFLPWKQEAE